MDRTYTVENISRGNVKNITVQENGRVKGTESTYATVHEAKNILYTVKWRGTKAYRTRYIIIKHA